ncbi:MAG: KaiC domain-containing protein [Candidatus Thermoplasmatota archaeon]|nr:KaiC domain-containing protein [Candidatus Thermoplasmatota archaeon]
MRRIKTGIDGLDELLKGGIPEGHVFTVMGAFGTGKTTFSLQYIWEGLQQGESGIFITLEEDKDAMIETGLSYGWDFEPYIEDDQLAVEKLIPADAEATIQRIKSDLPKFIKNFDAERIAIDSVSLLNMLADDPEEKRDQLFALTKMIKDTGTTALLTAEVKDENPESSRDGLIEYTADGVILLRYNQTDTGDVQLSIQVKKMRRIDHSRKMKPFVITDSGIDVQVDGTIF